MKLRRSSPTVLNATARTNLAFGILLALGLFVGSGLIAFINTRTLNRNGRRIAETQEILLALNDILSLATDAETGQRGFIITGEEKYLAPYSAALLKIDGRIADLEKLVADSPEQLSRIAPLREGWKTKLFELKHTLELRRAGGFEAAKAHISTDRGKEAMDAIRIQLKEMHSSERIRRNQQVQAMELAYGVAVSSGFVTCAVGVILSCVVAYLVRRSLLARQMQDWMKEGQIGLSKVMVGEPRLEKLGDNVLTFLADYLDAQAGAFFAREGNTFVRLATYGIPAGSNVPQKVHLGDGLLGQAAKDGRPIVVHDLPHGYISLGSALGHGVPQHLVIVPLKSDNVVNAIIELGFVRPLQDSLKVLFDRESGSIGVAVQSANDRFRLQSLLEETQRQAEEMQTQGEELRVSNEELEEQSRALKESQLRMELQQTELEQTNTQLEQQARILQTQRDDISRAKTALQEKANELEQASRYKSDFLANMSHELRTPLNSSLILSKLLADNPDGNLSEEQVRYAETIRAAGNDLLNLINDILDLSKIEAGHMEVHSDAVRVSQITENLSRVFQPIADQKGLSFQIRALPGCPDAIVTDRQRLEQILKNLLSNAMKFTEQGTVTFTVGPAEAQSVRFDVTDTGIGIPAQHQQMIFEAFRQADGTTNRKYGGTGLGLSISRELSRCLGGDIRLKSEPGHGSTFTLTIPEIFEPDQTPESASKSNHEERDPRSLEQRSQGTVPETKNSEGTVAQQRPRRSIPRVDDDRNQLSGQTRVILIVEDDESFARILYDLTHELNFQCLIAMSAEEGLNLAIQYGPSAVILDVGLPDQSGLSVLDRLKHDARTRHIPVHVVSAGDYAKTAMAMGAVGYMLKPVKREDLTEALGRLEARLDQRMRRVLVVEDDAVQLDSLQKLLGTKDVETVGARSAAECLEQLKQTTFDCMVLDLSLPDASGYSLLETLSREDAYAFPPVIVYTGRDLSIDEEQNLRKYSKSIIIKGAKSPERLLDEVTLFLHQVVSELPAEQQKMLEKARSRDAAIEGRRILIVEDDVRNVFALTSILEPRGARVEIARNGVEAIERIRQMSTGQNAAIDLVLMDVMMPEMDGITATREIRKQPNGKKLPIIMLTAKAMSDDQERCLAAGANDYMSKPLDVEKLLSLIRVWMPR